MKVLIVGAGPTGLTTGIELARKGAQVTIIERREGDSTLSRAVGINPCSLEILDASGVTEKLLAQGIKYRSLMVYNADKPWATLPLTAASTKYGYNFILGLPQDQTEKVLRETFRSFGGEIHYKTKLANLRQERDQVFAHTDTGEEFSCDYMVGADGSHSTTRQCLGLERTEIKLPNKWSIADVDADQWHANTALTIFVLQEGKMLAIAPLGSGRFRLVSNTDKALEALPLDIGVTHMRREAQFDVSISQVKEYSKGRVFLAGDAAHTHSPVGGRGMNLGIADGANLADRLINGNLSSYSHDCHAIGKAVIESSEQMRKIISRPSPVSRSFLLAGLKAISVCPPLQKVFANKFLYG